MGWLSGTRLSHRHSRSTVSEQVGLRDAREMAADMVVELPVVAERFELRVGGQRFSVSESGIDAGQVISERANEGVSCKSLQYKELQN